MYESNGLVYAGEPRRMRRITDVSVLDDYKLLVRFSDGIRRVFDMTSYLDKGVFAQLKDVEVFRSVKINPDFGCLEWKDGEIDIDTGTVYLSGLAVD